MKWKWKGFSPLSVHISQFRLTSTKHSRLTMHQDVCKHLNHDNTVKHLELPRKLWEIWSSDYTAGVKATSFKLHTFAAFHFICTKLNLFRPPKFTRTVKKTCKNFGQWGNLDMKKNFKKIGNYLRKITLKIEIKQKV